MGLLLADAYARENRTQEEFALYDEELADLARRAGSVPLGIKSASAGAITRYRSRRDAEAGIPKLVGSRSESGARAMRHPQQASAFSTQVRTIVHAPKSARRGTRIISSAISPGLPRCTSFRRRSRSCARRWTAIPTIPDLYERLAQFLEQNRLGQSRKRFTSAPCNRFPDRSWYHKLARFYLRQKRDADFSRLSEQVVKIFSGTELGGILLRRGERCPVLHPPQRIRPCKVSA